MDKLLKVSKNDIPFVQAKLVIHNPSIKEIAYVGEQNFLLGCNYLTFSKDLLKEQDKTHLQNYSDFEILMAIIKKATDDIAVKKIKICMEMVLSLLFPNYRINFLPESIMLSNETERCLIDKDNFEIFRNIVSDMFCLSMIKSKSSHKYNPRGPQAQALVKKFQERERKLAQIKRRKGQLEEPESLFFQYLSILSVGENKDINQLLQYNVYQLFTEFCRFRMKENFDMYVQAKMAGAKDLDDTDHWMGTLNLEDF